jgi:hypothetical protein
MHEISKQELGVVQYGNQARITSYKINWFMISNIQVHV